MVTPRSAAVEHLPCLLGRLDIGPPPGLEHLAPSKTHERADSIPLEPAFVTTTGLDRCIVMPEMAAEADVAGNSRAIQRNLRKARRGLSTSGFSDCNPATSVLSEHAPTGGIVQMGLRPSASTARSSWVSSRGSESSRPVMPPNTNEDTKRVGFCGTTVRILLAPSFIRRAHASHATSVVKAVAARAWTATSATSVLMRTPSERNGSPRRLPVGS
eukprot:TRINITY_DN22299_c0_g1_i1.p1 TRINITY_DN22299_c0_g1~~TRINITY_DN22299_c0_g1_i1.p1  ORF type:complete len:215 (-),score=14.47 TRINITY_DN22299_c0_g1_i1:904-1548(-)